MRADCRFAHDLKQITCKYWLDGECLKGDNCEFSHEYIEETPHKVLLTFGGKKAAKANSLPKQEFKLDSEEFPALGGASKKSAQIETTPKQTGSSSISVTPPVQLPMEEQTSGILFKTAASVLQSRAPVASPVTPKASQKKTSNESIGKKPVLQAASTGKSGRKSRESQAPKQTKSASAIMTTGKSQVAAVPIKTAVSKSNANNSCGSSSSSASSSSSSASSSSGSNSSSRCNSIIRGKK